MCGNYATLELNFRKTYKRNVISSFKKAVMVRSIAQATIMQSYFKGEMDEFVNDGRKGNLIGG